MKVEKPSENGTSANGNGTIPALFLSQSSPDVGVFESQVLDQAQLLGELGVHFRYVIFEGIRARRDPRIAERLASFRATQVTRC